MDRFSRSGEAFSRMGKIFTLFRGKSSSLPGRLQSIKSLSENEKVIGFLTEYQGGGTRPDFKKRVCVGAAKFRR
jgi:hypothetical protein